MGNEKLKRQERLFQKNIYLPKERKAEFEAMAEKGGVKLATFIQDNVGNFWQVEEFVKDAVFQVEARTKREGIEAGRKEAVFQLQEIVDFIEALKTKA